MTSIQTPPLFDTNRAELPTDPSSAPQENAKSITPSVTSNPTPLNADSPSTRAYKSGLPSRPGTPNASTATHDTRASESEPAPPSTSNQVQQRLQVLSAVPTPPTPQATLSHWLHQSLQDKYGQNIDPDHTYLISLNYNTGGKPDQGPYPGQVVRKESLTDAALHNTQEADVGAAGNTLVPYRAGGPNIQLTSALPIKRPDGLTDLAYRYWVHGHDEKADYTYTYEGIYKEGDEAHYSAANQLALDPKDFRATVWNNDPSQVVKSQLNTFWGEHEKDYAQQARVSFFAAADTGIPTYPSASYPPGALKPEDRALAARMLQQPPSTEIDSGRLHIGDYVASDVMYAKDKHSGRILLYTPGDTTPLQGFDSLDDLRNSLATAMKDPASRDALMGHFKAYDQRDGSNNVFGKAGVNGILNGVAAYPDTYAPPDLLWHKGPWDPGRYIGLTPQHGDAFEHLTDDVKARTYADAQTLVTSDRDVTERNVLKWMDIGGVVLGAALVPLSLASTGAGLLAKIATAADVGTGVGSVAIGMDQTHRNKPEGTDSFVGGLMQLGLVGGFKAMEVHGNTEKSASGSPPKDTPTKPIKPNDVANSDRPPDGMESITLPNDPATYYAYRTVDSNRPRELYTRDQDGNLTGTGKHIDAHAQRVQTKGGMNPPDRAHRQNPPATIDDELTLLTGVPTTAQDLDDFLASTEHTPTSPFRHLLSRPSTSAASGTMDDELTRLAGIPTTVQDLERFIRSQARESLDGSSPRPGASTAVSSQGGSSASGARPSTAVTSRARTIDVGADHRIAEGRISLSRISTLEPNVSRGANRLTIRGPGVVHYRVTNLTPHPYMQMAAVEKALRDSGYALVEEREVRERGLPITYIKATKPGEGSFYVLPRRAQLQGRTIYVNRAKTLPGDPNLPIMFAVYLADADQHGGTLYFQSYRPGALPSGHDDPSSQSGTSSAVSSQGRGPASGAGPSTAGTRGASIGASADGSIAEGQLSLPSISALDPVAVPRLKTTKIDTLSAVRYRVANVPYRIVTPVNAVEKALEDSGYTVVEESNNSRRGGSVIYLKATKPGEGSFYVLPRRATQQGGLLYMNAVVRPPQDANIPLIHASYFANDGGRGGTIYFQNYRLDAPPSGHHDPLPQPSTSTAVSWWEGSSASAAGPSTAGASSVSTIDVGGDRSLAGGHISLSSLSARDPIAVPTFKMQRVYESIAARYHVANVPYSIVTPAKAVETALKDSGYTVVEEWTDPQFGVSVVYLKATKPGEGSFYVLPRKAILRGRLLYMNAVLKPPQDANIPLIHASYFADDGGRGGTIYFQTYRLRAPR